jgi:protein-S-isoprenylcysteine O-methyltransferase Ste14
MFPILVTMYVRLARREEREVLAEFGHVYARYAATTPGVFPTPGSRGTARVRKETR